MDGSAHDALNPVGSRWLNRQFATACLQSFDQRCWLASGLSHGVIAQPLDQPLGIGHGGFAKTEISSNLGTMPFGGAPEEGQNTRQRERKVQLVHQFWIPSRSSSDSA
jgi:hypothetical protein